MTLEYIVRAALKDMQTGRESAHCGNPARPQDGEPLEGIDRAEGYSEPGYDDPRKGVLLANWNQYPGRLIDLLEKQGYAIEWSDEWATCDDCGKLVRTSANSYDWQPSYTLVDDCSVVCKDCIDAEDYLKSIENNPQVCNVFAHIDPADYGYEKYNGTYESGWHPGQTDDPKAIYAMLREKGYTRVLFTLKENSQFYSTFTAWTKAEE